MKCITLTLNPAFDKHCFVKELMLGHEHLAESDSFDAGGKGVNISRALTVNGIESNAVVVLGKENKEAFCAALESSNMKYAAITIEGKVRENLTIHTLSGIETRISFKGFNTDDALLDEVYSIIENDLSSDAILTFTGSAPVGISMAAINSFLKKASDKGCKVVIDSKSFKTLEEIVALKPWLIKPNCEEISEYIGKNISDYNEILEVAQKLHNDGIENVMISLGSKGAMLVCDDGAYIGTPPDVKVKSTIGAGDSSIAGFISAVMMNESIENALKTSMAYGTAACMQEGTNPPLPKDVAEAFEKVIIRKL